MASSSAIRPPAGPYPGFLASPPELPHKYNPLPSIPVADPHLNRLARIGCNSRNVSDSVFQFGGPLDDSQRRDPPSAVQAEHDRQESNRAKQAQRIAFKRSWKDDLEMRRRQQMENDARREESRMAAKSSAWRAARHSSGFDPVTLAYVGGPEGQALRQKDEADKDAVGHRAVRMYFRHNTFDPLRCQDVTPVPSVLNKGRGGGKKTFAAARDVQEVVSSIVPVKEGGGWASGAERAVKEAVVAAGKGRS
ncbi:hypothetical protein DFS34DRAFT_157853 [Phlyctochytrium arcticum]|nr:hypothetical protein DFS34DRAFT_157853 [Phlyctochytrium arcticum]